MLIFKYFINFNFYIIIKYLTARCVTASVHKISSKYFFFVTSSISIITPCVYLFNS